MEDFDVSVFFQTKQQSADFLQGLTRIIESLYRTDFQLEKLLLETFGLAKRDAFLAFLRNHNVDSNNVTTLKEFLTKMQEYIQTLPVLSLTIAFEPKEETLKTLEQWFIGQIHTQVLLEITVNPSILGGATMTYKGKYLDYSIKPVFTKTSSEMIKNMYSHASQTPQPTALAGHQSTEHITLGR